MFIGTIRIIPLGSSSLSAAEDFVVARALFEQTFIHSDTQ